MTRVWQRSINVYWRYHGNNIIWGTQIDAWTDRLNDNNVFHTVWQWWRHKNTSSTSPRVCRNLHTVHHRVVSVSWCRSRCRCTVPCDPAVSPAGHDAVDTSVSRPCRQRPRPSASVVARATHSHPTGQVQNTHAHIDTFTILTAISR